MGVLDTLKVHQCEEVPTRKIAAFSYFYDRAVDAGIIEHGQSAVVQVGGGGVVNHQYFYFIYKLVK